MRSRSADKLGRCRRSHPPSIRSRPFEIDDAGPCSVIVGRVIVSAGVDAIRVHREVGVQSLVSLSAFPKSGVTYLSFLLFHGLFPDSADVHDLERKYIIDIHAHPRAAPAT